MLCWANANWGRNWEGGHNITLIEQKYSDEDDIAHFEYLLPFFKDPRYIRINGKPVFGVHRSDYIPDFEKSIGIWQRLAAKEGFQLYICRFEAGGFIGENIKPRLLMQQLNSNHLIWDDFGRCIIYSLGDLNEFLKGL